MKKCLNCKALNPDFVVYCQNCGSYLPLEKTGEYFDILKSFLLGFLLTAILYVFVLPAVEWVYIRQLFDSVIAEAIVGLTLWSLFLVGFKFVRYRDQATAYRRFRHKEVSQIFAQGVYALNVDERLKDISEFLQKQKIKRYQSSLIFRRVRRLFHHIKAIPKKEEINKILDYQAQMDFNRMDNGYTLLNVFIWAIPILGFIGTVYGIGEAIGEFSSFIRSVSSVELGNQMRSALGGVTSGLSIAFNTTFLALVFVIPIMVLSSFLRKAEEDLLLGIEDYCLEEVLPHLHIVPGTQGESENYEEHMQKIMQLSGNWVSRLDPLMDSLANYASGLKHQVTGLQPLVKEFSDNMFAVKDSPAAQENTSQPTNSNPTPPPSALQSTISVLPAAPPPNMNPPSPEANTVDTSSGSTSTETETPHSKAPQQTAAHEPTTTSKIDDETVNSQITNTINPQPATSSSSANDKSPKLGTDDTVSSSPNDSQAGTSNLEEGKADLPPRTEVS